MKLTDTSPWKKKYDKPRHHIKKQTHHFANKFPSSQNYAFSSSHVWMWEFHHKKKVECWRIEDLNCGAGEALESPLDSKEIKPVNEINHEYSL